MSTRAREEDAGAVHHVYARGVRSAPIYADDEDRQTYLQMLSRMLPWNDWRCLAFCLMTNHVHLLLETVKPNLGIGMSRFHGEYAKMFNQRHGFVGHVFQGRYGNTRIKDDVHLVTALRYVEGNPAEAGLVDWPWVSSRRPAPSWLAKERLGALLRGDPV